MKTTTRTHLAQHTVLLLLPLTKSTNQSNDKEQLPNPTTIRNQQNTAYIDSMSDKERERERER